MTSPVPALEFDALLGKSKYYIGKALLRADEGDLEEYQLWASLALELLGKACLAKLHPSLVADPNHALSLFAAAGISKSTDIKTITAKTLFERIKQLCPQFDPSVQKFCTEISQRRNSELHSGDAPFKAMRRDAWESKYWRACKVILTFGGMSLAEWLGNELAATPQQIIETRSAAIEAEVMANIEDRKEFFSSKPQAEREKLLAAFFEPSESGVKEIFDHYPFNEKEWVVECPACGGDGFLAGDAVSEEITGHDEEWSTWETVEKRYQADEFACPRCHLKIVGFEPLSSTGLELGHVEEEEREIEYEPEYGNC